MALKLNKNGISLIETLISLSIVGISLVALLPVMTVRQNAFSTTRGNDNFQKFEAYISANTPEYYTPKDNIRTVIGNIDNNMSIYPVYANASGYNYSGVLPLYVQNRLYFNTNKVQSINDGILISSGDALNRIANIAYPTNVFIHNRGVVVTNNNANHFIAPQLDLAGNYLINKNFGAASIDFSDNNMQAYIFSNANNELINVTQKQTAAGAQYTHIGIGENAIANYTTTTDFIGIYNEINSPLRDIAPPGADTVDLGIGRNNTDNNFDNQNNYIISHKRNDGFMLNSNILTIANGANFTVNSIVVGSDKRLKTILGNYKKGLKEIIKINPVEFVYKNDEKKTHHIGVIAQDLKKTIPESVIKNSTTGYYMVSTEPIFYALLNSIKELNNKNIELKNENDKLEQKIITLRKLAKEQQHE